MQCFSLNYPWREEKRIHFTFSFFLSSSRNGECTRNANKERRFTMQIHLMLHEEEGDFDLDLLLVVDRKLSLHWAREPSESFGKKSFYSIELWRASESFISCLLLFRLLIEMKTTMMMTTDDKCACKIAPKLLLCGPAQVRVNAWKMMLWYVLRSLFSCFSHTQRQLESTTISSRVVCGGRLSAAARKECEKLSHSVAPLYSAMMKNYRLTRNTQAASFSTFFLSSFVVWFIRCHFHRLLVGLGEEIEWDGMVNISLHNGTSGACRVSTEWNW